MIHLKTIITHFVKFFIYSIIIILIDTIMILLFSWGVDTFTYTLSFIILIEGGLGLILGGVSAFYSPSTSKVSEVLFRSKPWNFTRQKEVEKQMGAVIMTSIILIIEALFVSAL